MATELSGIPTHLSSETNNMLFNDYSSSTEAVNKMMKRAAFDVYLRNSEDAFQLLSV